MTLPICYGLDLSGPANPKDTALVRLVADEGDWRVQDCLLGLGDDEIRASFDNVPRPAWIGLDAPLSYEPGGGLRDRDRELRDRLAADGFDRTYVLPPTMTRMIYLTARGMTVARTAAGDDRTILEVHPTAALLLRGAPEAAVKQLREDAKARETVLETLRACGVRDIPSSAAESDHSVAALAAALATADAAFDDATWRTPADPPAHPFPLVV